MQLSSVNLPSAYLAERPDGLDDVKPQSVHSSSVLNIESFYDRSGLIEHISRLPHARATFKQLVSETGAKGTTQEELEDALNRLTERGELIELRSGQFVVTARSREFSTLTISPSVLGDRNAKAHTLSFLLVNCHERIVYSLSTIRYFDQCLA